MKTSRPRNTYAEGQLPALQLPVAGDILPQEGSRLPLPLPGTSLGWMFMFFVLKLFLRTENPATLNTA